MQSTPDPIRHNQLVDIARLYYLRNMTHQQIAAKLGLSRVKVTRLVQQAVDEGIVEFRIADPAVEALELQDRLEQAYGLSQVLVVAGADTQGGSLDALGRCAAAWLSDRLEDDMVVGLGWGRTLNAMLPHLGRSPRRSLTVVSLTGGLAANASQPNPYDTATGVAARIGAQPRYLLVPAVVDTVEAHDVLLAQATASSVTALWSRVQVAMMSIGVLAPNTGVFYSLADPDAAVESAIAAGGVGDLLARPFDSAGRFIAVEHAARTIAIESSQLKRVRHVVGVAGGVEKVNAIEGALRTGLLNVLITDETAARALVQRIA